MHIVTAGYPFMDIDAYAASVAMAELLRLQGEKAIAASNAPFNASIPDSLRTLNVEFDRSYKPSPDDTYTIVDLSDPAYFDLQATPEKVVAIIDHHLDFTDYWRNKIGDQARIEFIGAACTLVYELWHKAGLLGKMSKNSAKLLACGILDNTLNLKATITTDRDKTAYDELAQHAELPANWPEEYFEECQRYIGNHLEEALPNDSKPIQYPSLSYRAYVGQFTLWNAQKLISSQQQDITKIMSQQDHPWFVNFIDIHTNRSVFYCEDIALQQWIEQTLDVVFDANLATANRMWLRKEIMKRSMTLTKQTRVD